MASAHPEGGAGLVADDLRDAWPALDLEERLEGFRLLEPGEAEFKFYAEGVGLLKDGPARLISVRRG